MQRFLSLFPDISYKYCITVSYCLLLLQKGKLKITSHRMYTVLYALVARNCICLSEPMTVVASVFSQKKI